MTDGDDAVLEFLLIQPIVQRLIDRRGDTPAPSPVAPIIKVVPAQASHGSLGTAFRQWSCAAA